MHAVSLNSSGSFQGTPLATRSDATSCLVGIRQGDPGAAQKLYEVYGASIRRYFRRWPGIRDLEGAVFSTLLQVVRSVRQLEIVEPDELTHTVRTLCAQQLFDLSKTDAANAMTLDRRGEVVNRLFTAMDSAEREVMLRSCVLLQREDDIAREASVSLTHVRRTQAKARALFRACCEETAAPPPHMIV